MFVGRTRELAALEAALEAARDGSGSTALVAGDAGIGKSRLVAELAAHAAGCTVLLGRCLDLVGTELPYQPFAEALGGLPARGAGSQLRVFEEALTALDERAAGAPILLVLEDLHWADTSTLDLVVFLAHNLADRPVLLAGTYRADEPASAARMRRLADAARRSEAALTIELGPLAPDELSALLSAQGGSPALASALAARADGNPFFAQELLAASGHGELPHALRDLLLRRVARLDRATQGLLRLAAAAGRDVSYALLRAAAGRPEEEVRDSLREAVEHGVLVADSDRGSFRFRHALLAEAIYATVLPGEREALHGRVADELVRDGNAVSAELAPHWAAAGRSAEALAASIAAAREAEAVFGLAEALGHRERALALWHAVPDAPALVGCDLAQLCARTADLADKVGAASRAVELARRAIALVDDPRRAARLHVDLGEYLYATGADEPALAALERAVELAPARPPSPERAYALGSLAGGLMLLSRHADSLPLAEVALALARELGAGEAEVRALTVIGADLAHLSQGAEGLQYMRTALALADAIGDTIGLERAYVNLTDALTMLGRSREAAQLALAGLEAMRRRGVHSALLIANRVEALLEIGDWDEADALSAAALRDTTSSFRSWLLILRAGVETGRGELDAARTRLETVTVDGYRDRPLALYHAYVAELALWERRWADAEQAIADGLAPASGREAAQVHVQLCALGLRAQTELAALARALRDAGARRDRLNRAGRLLATARRAAADAASITPTAGAWLALAEAEHARGHGGVRPEPWAKAAAAWERLERAPLAAYCRLRQSEALVAAGAPRAEAVAPLRDAYAAATRLRARPLLDEIERLAARARLDPAPPPAPPPALSPELDLTPRESEVLALVARGLTNREIADQLVISVKTASVHVSHILRKLDAPSRVEAAAIAHRVALPPTARPRA